jgi:hypothetical protein
MKVKDAIAQLMEHEDKEQDIVIAWWYADSFDREEDEEWSKLCDLTDRKMDWSGVHEDIDGFLSFAEGHYK